MDIPDDIEAWFDAQDAISPFDDDADATDENDVHWGSYFSRFWGRTLGLCGCGTDAPKRVVARLMWALASEHQARDPKNGMLTTMASTFYGAGWNEPIVEFALHVLDAHGLLDHGGSVNASWLSEKGVEEARIMFDEVNPPVSPA